MPNPVQEYARDTCFRCDLSQITSLDSDAAAGAAVLFLFHWPWTKFSVIIIIAPWWWSQRLVVVVSKFDVSLAIGGSRAILERLLRNTITYKNALPCRLGKSAMVDDRKEDWDFIFGRISNDNGGMWRIDSLMSFTEVVLLFLFVSSSISLSLRLNSLKVVNYPHFIDLSDSSPPPSNRAMENAYMQKEMCDRHRPTAFQIEVKWARAAR